MVKRYQLSESFIKTLSRHLSVILEHVDSKGRPRIAYTVRLAKKDLKKLEKIIQDERTDILPQ
jgi:hypothetical protein